MDSSTWIAIYFPLFIVFFIIIPEERRLKKILLTKIRKRKGWKTMNNDLIKKCIGKECKISSNFFTFDIVGKVVDVKENWIEIETKKGPEFLNADLIQRIKTK